MFACVVPSGARVCASPSRALRVGGCWGGGRRGPGAPSHANFPSRPPREDAVLPRPVLAREVSELRFCPHHRQRMPACAFLLTKGQWGNYEPDRDHVFSAVVPPPPHVICLSRYSVLLTVQFIQVAP